MPDEIYNLAAQADAVTSISEPEDTLLVNANSVMTICEVIRSLSTTKQIKLFQANSSEIFKGLTLKGTDNEKALIIDETKLEFYPKNPYAIAKLTAYWSVRNYREYHKLFLCNGIIFNAESPRRNPKFVVNKIARTIRAMKTNDQIQLIIGDLEAQRDWIHAYDVAMAAWTVLQQNDSDDYMISLNSHHTVRDTIQQACNITDIDITWKGDKQTMNEFGINAKTGQVLVTIDPKLFRPYELKTIPLVGNNTKLKSTGWSPKYSWSDMITEMVTSGLD